MKEAMNPQCPSCYDLLRRIDRLESLLAAYESDPKHPEPPIVKGALDAQAEAEQRCFAMRSRIHNACDRLRAVSGKPNDGPKDLEDYVADAADSLGKFQSSELTLRALLRECSYDVYRQRFHGKHEQDRADAEALWIKLVEVSADWGKERILR